MPEEKSTVKIWYLERDDALAADIAMHEFAGNIRIIETGSVLSFHVANWTFAIQVTRLVNYRVEGHAAIYIKLVEPQAVLWKVESGRHNDSVWPEVMVPGAQVILDTGERVTVRKSEHPVRGIASVVEDGRGIIYEHSIDRYRWMNPGDWH